MTAIFPNELPRLSLLEQAVTVREWFQRHESSRLRSDNRVLQLCDAVESAGSDIVLPKDVRYPRVVQALKDLQEFAFIILVLGEQLAEEPFLSRLRHALNDTSVPDDKQSNIRTPAPAARAARLRLASPCPVVVLMYTPLAALPRHKGLPMSAIA
jgi:hypothetical protein